NHRQKCERIEKDWEMNEIIINHKICDNSPACGGIEVCPTGAMFWDEKNSQIGFAKEKCVGCGACKNMCPVRAIMLARDTAEAQKIKADIDSDPRAAADLFVDRYGADITETQPAETGKAAAAARAAKGVAVLELYDEETLHCLATSIPYSEIFAGTDVKLIRAQTDAQIAKEFDISEIPAMVIFRNGKIIGKIQGYFFNDSPAEKSLLIAKTNEIMK
ncbi:MAG: 4Fe-4S binding protein, partial [Rickettsiales bacterium]|nr:4Fe-4S binding protein [Rickettsiales bacterium]